MNEDEEVVEVEETVINSGWEDDGPESTPEEPADQPEDRVGEGSEIPQSASPTAPLVKGPSLGGDAGAKGVEAKPADQPEAFTLKHLDETKTVSREEVVSLAQKGMDYDRVQTERDQLRTYRQEADPALNLVKSYATRNGMDVAGYIDYCRKQELVAQGVNEQTAAAQVEVEKQRSLLEAQNTQVEADRQRQEAQRQERERRSEERTRDMSAFLTAYPDVKPETIHPKVWERVAKGESLMGAYTMHRNAELEATLAAERQNKQNASLTTGSRATAGAENQRSAIDRAWDDVD